MMLAVEIDGSQHILDDDRIKRDQEKNDVLIQNGWTVLRISEHAVKNDWNIIKKNLDLYLNSDVPQTIKVGIFQAPKTRIKPSRNEMGYTAKQEESYIKQRKVVNRPSKEVLFKEINDMTFVQVGKKYGVTDNTIRKWCKLYNLPYRKKDMK